jgi:hypothetical protein
MVSRLGGGLGGGRPLTAAEQPQQGSKLFPRSSLSGPEGAGRAGPAEERAPGYPMGGSPGAKKDQEKQRKHSDLLNSTEHLDEAIGELDRSVRPVLDR